MSENKLLKGSLCIFLAFSIVALLSVNVPRVKAIDKTAYILHPVIFYPCDNAGARKTEFDQTETIYVCGSGFDPYEDMIIRVIPNAHAYLAAESVRDVTATASDTGHLGPVALGTLPPGKYDVWADRNMNGWLEMGSTLTGSKPEPVCGFGMCYIGFLVVPEYLFGTILGLAGCFGALGVFRLSKHRHK